MSLIRKHVAVLQAWACLDLVYSQVDIRAINLITHNKLAVVALLLIGFFR